MRRVSVLAVVVLLFAVAAQAQTFVACRPGVAARPADVKQADRPLWRAEGFETREAAEVFQQNVQPTGLVVTLTQGAKRPWLVVWNTGPFDWDRYLGPTHWPVRTYGSDEWPLAFNDLDTHDLLREPSAIFSSGDPAWPVLVAFEASAPCESSKRRAVHGEADQGGGSSD